MSKSRLNWSLIKLFQFIVYQCFTMISAIRKDIGFQQKSFCRTTTQGRYLLSDDSVQKPRITKKLCCHLPPKCDLKILLCYVCDALSLDPSSRCCPQKGFKFYCHGCNLVTQCCKSYEYCVSCCLNPSRTQKEQALKVKIAKPATAGTYASVFDFCAGRCRHNSDSVVHENAYVSNFHHCFSLHSNSSEATSGTNTETRLAGINIVVGKQGESCDSVCKSNGQSCVANKLLVLNQCDIMQKHLSCKGGCSASMGADQPAEVVADAPKNLNPGACLYTQTQSMLSCDGFHQHTKRLCPCA